MSLASIRKEIPNLDKRELLDVVELCNAHISQMEEKTRKAWRPDESNDDWVWFNHQWCYKLHNQDYGG